MHIFRRTEINRIAKPGATILIGMPAVNKMMEWGFRAIGFKDIDHHHVTTPNRLLQASKKYFELVERKAMPFDFPVVMALYNTFLFRARK